MSRLGKALPAPSTIYRKNGCSALLSPANQQTLGRAAGHPENKSMWPAGGEGEETLFLRVRRQATLRPFLPLAEVTQKTRDPP